MRRIIVFLAIITITCLMFSVIAQGDASKVTNNEENYKKILSIPVEFNGKSDDKVSVYLKKYEESLSYYEDGPTSF